MKILFCDEVPRRPETLRASFQRKRFLTSPANAVAELGLDVDVIIPIMHTLEPASYCPHKGAADSTMGCGAGGGGHPSGQRKGHSRLQRSERRDFQRRIDSRARGLPDAGRSKENTRMPGCVPERNVASSCRGRTFRQHSVDRRVGSRGQSTGKAIKSTGDDRCVQSAEQRTTNRESSWVRARRLSVGSA